MLEGLLGNQSKSIGLEITKVQNGYLVEIPSDGSGFEKLLKAAVKIQDDAADPILAKARANEEDGDKLSAIPNQFVFYTIKEVLEFLKFWFYDNQVKEESY